MSTVTRFAPSPTGYLHIGGLRTALFNYLHARKNGGVFRLRIEDTDNARNNAEALKAIIEAFNWVGMEYDDVVEYQSERMEIYKSYIERMLSEGSAYHCYMSKEELDELRAGQEARGERPRYDNRYRDFTGTPPAGVSPAVRIKAPLTGKITFKDGVKGDMVFDASEVDDFIIARSDGSPAYNFVVAIDDHLMGMSDVIRGDDHLSNTPKQIVVYNALGFAVPKFYHVPMILNPQGKKLSKRDGAMDVMEYQRLGYLPEALLNFLVRLGWSHGDQEIFSRTELLELFDPSTLNTSPSAYNEEKLLWLNAHYIKNKSNDDLATLLEAFGLMMASHDKKEILLDLAKERAKTLVEIADTIKLIINTPEVYDAKDVEKFATPTAIEMVKAYIQVIENARATLHLPSDYEALSKEYLHTHNIKMPDLFKPLRVVLLGTSNSPSVYDVMAAIGVDGILGRLSAFLSRH